VEPAESTPDPREEQIGRILNDFLDARARGEPVSEDELFARYPEFADQLREHLAMLREMGGMPGAGRADGSDTTDQTLDIRGTGSSFASLPHDSFTGYEIIHEVHRGGQGVVYQAIQKATKRKVAIKVMKEGPFAGSRDKARFEREVQILGALNHPNIVTIHDSGIASGHHYFVMDYISGQPLEVWMASGQRSIEETLKLFAKICEAVNAAHLKGVIHRDLKPGNIRIDNQGEPHVLDFGLAKMATAEVTNGSRPQVMTVTGQFVGSLPWASPEQAEGAPDKIDTRTDVYSLGVILYEMLTGKFPYEVIGNMRDVLDRIMKSEPAKPSTIRRQINDEVETIVLKCLSKERERRYQTAGELARDVGHYLKGEPIEAKRDSGMYVLRKQLRRYRLPVAIGAAFVILVTVALVLSTTLWQRAARERNRADAERLRAEAATTQAIGERERAEAARAREEEQAYVANITAADASLRCNEGAVVRACLEACPVQLRGWEWHHLNALADNSVGTLGRADSRKTAVFSPNGRCVLTVPGDNTVWLWDAATGKELFTLRDSTGVIADAAFSQTGNRVLTVSRADTGKAYSVKLWEAATGKELLTLQYHTGFGVSAEFSPDESRIIVSSELAPGVVSLCDAVTGKELLALADEFTAGLSPDGGRMLTWHDRTAKLWDAQTGQEVVTLSGHTDGVLSAAFSPDGKSVLTASRDETAKLWDAQTGQEVVTLSGHTDDVRSAAFSPDGKSVLTASNDKTAKLWDAKTGKVRVTLRGHDSAVFSADGTRVLLVSEDDTALLCDAETGRELATLRAVSIDRLWCGAGFSPDGRRVLTFPNPTTAMLSDAVTGGELRTLRGHTSYLVSAQFSPDGTHLLTASVDGIAKLWDTASGEELATLRGHTCAITCVRFSSDGRRMLTQSVDGTVKLWEASTAGEPIMLLGHSSGSAAKRCWAVFSPDGRRLLLDSRYDKELWNAETGKKVATLAAHHAEFSADGSRVVTVPNGEDAKLKLWEAATGKELLTLRGHTGSVYSAVFGPNGKSVLTASEDKTAKLWDAQTGQEVVTLSGHTDGVFSAAFSPDGKSVLTVSKDKTAKLWDAQTGQEVVTLSGHIDDVRSAAFSPDGKSVLTASKDKTAKLWDAKTGKEVVTLSGHTNDAFSAAFSPDGKRVLTESHDGTAKLWDAEAGKELLTLRENACYGVELSCDGKRILTTAYGKAVRLWNTETGQELAMLRKPTDIEMLAPGVFSPDGKRVLLGAEDGTAKLFDAATGQELLTLRGHVGPPVLAAVFSPDGRRIVTTGPEGVAIIRDSIPHRVRFVERESRSSEGTPGACNQVADTTPSS